MPNFISVPVVDSFKIEETDSGYPFTNSAVAIQNTSFLYRGIYAGITGDSAWIGRVDNECFILSIQPLRCYIWYSGNNFTTFADTVSTDKENVCCVSVGNVRNWAIHPENFTTYEEMIDSFYATIVFPDNPPVSGSIIISINPTNSSGTIDVDLPAIIEGAETIVVKGKTSSIDTNNSGGNSLPSIPSGTFDDTSDPIPVPELPTISAAQSGMIALFRPTIADLRALGSYLWTNIGDFIENLNKLFMNPMDYMVALNILPCMPDVGARVNINIGSFTTDIDMPPILNQWYEFNCGTVRLSEYWGSALDYAPNTKVSLMLPFIGSVTLNTDEIMGRDIGVIYHIDLLSGQCVAMVTASLVDRTPSVLYQFTGECAVSIPLTGADWSRIYSAAVGAVGTAITGGIAAGAAGAAAGGATSALAGANAAEAASNAGLAYAMINDTSKGIKGVQQMRQDMQKATQLALQAGERAAAQPARVANGVRATRIANTVNNTIGSVISGKATVNHAGTISGSAGMLGVRTPYLLIEYPNQSLADNYKHFVGYPSNMYARLGDLTGYTEVEQVLANSLVNQTDSEMSELLEALKGGVYL